jgi:hypothetical protein
MITLVLFEDEWHILTLMDGAILCRLDREDWDDPFHGGEPDDVRQVDALDESVCMLCVKHAYDHDMFGRR